MSDTLRNLLEQVLAEGPYLNGGVCRIAADGAVETHVRGPIHPEAKTGPAVSPDLRMRMASISKAVTARVACELAVTGRLDLNAEVAGVLGWGDPPPLMRGVTVRMLLNHTSGLTDHAGYIFDRPTHVVAFIAGRAEQIGSGHRPGAWFKYCNLNYVLLGTVLEAVSGQRFDQLVRRHVLVPADIAGGFNWSGVPVALRGERLPIYQRIGARFVCQTEPDVADWSADIVWGDGRGFSRDAYVPERDTILFSPHAGLRMNVTEAARLARLLGDDTAAGRLQRQTTWTYDAAQPNGTSCDGLYGEVGLGLMIYRHDPRIPGCLIGHAGHALGFTGGVWHNESTGTSLAIALTGSADLTDGLDDEVFFAPAELSLMQAI